MFGYPVQALPLQGPPPEVARTHKLTSLSRTTTWSTRSQKRSSTYQQRGMTRTCGAGAHTQQRRHSQQRQRGSAGEKLPLR